MKRSMRARWLTLLIAPMRCWMKEVITTWWKFGPAIAGCIAQGGVARRKPKLNDSLVDLAAVRNRQSVHLGGDVSRVRQSTRLPRRSAMHVLAVFPERHRLSRFEVLDVTELADEPLLRLSSSFASHRWFEAACQVAHVRPRVLARKRCPTDADRTGPAWPRHCCGSISGSDST